MQQRQPSQHPRDHALSILKRLLACHGTPGDEEAVRDVLEASWKALGLKPVQLGERALFVELHARTRRPRLLITAHMDSPGYCISSLGRRASDPMAVIALGHPDFKGESVGVQIKTRHGLAPAILRRTASPKSEERPSYRLSLSTAQRQALRPDHGDRICFAPKVEIRGRRIRSPFLDNRLGCWLLILLASRAANWRSPYRIVLGATACEEMGGFGAPILARHIQPDLTVVLDTTYEAPDQNVRLGHGPVLTLSDASALLSPALRDHVRARFAKGGVSLQTEVYNFSGTDARAFPAQGIHTPVLPLLLATRHNHSPLETADLGDADALLAGLRLLAEQGL